MGHQREKEEEDTETQLRRHGGLRGQKSNGILKSSPSPSDSKTLAFCLFFVFATPPFLTGHRVPVCDQALKANQLLHLFWLHRVPPQEPLGLRGRGGDWNQPLVDRRGRLAIWPDVTEGRVRVEVERGQEARAGVRDMIKQQGPRASPLEEARGPASYHVGRDSTGDAFQTLP